MSEDAGNTEAAPGADLIQDAPSVQVNTQIVDAVRQTRAAMRIDADDSSRMVDSGINYQKVGQATAFAVQDATDYLRNVAAIAATAQGVALKLVLETKDDFYFKVITEAQAILASAAANLEIVGKCATTVATEFPR